MSKLILDSTTKYAVAGRIVTMDAQGIDGANRIIDRGIIYIEVEKIVDVLDKNDPPPVGFENVKIIKTRGTIYPGMIELHNHLSYNIAQMWDVPKKFLDRDQWRRHPDYKKKMTGPLKVLGYVDGYLQAIVRYVECKLLFSGTTSSQGITLSSHGGILKYYKGFVRNVEQTIDKDLPRAKTQIADVDTPEKLLKKLVHPKATCVLLHLAEGVHARANKHFKVLQLDQSNWAINENLAGIHGTGLLPEDFQILGQHKGSIIWSPMSNLLLYGTTTDIKSAYDSGVLISLGSDWSASGSKNLLGELKVAKLYSDQNGGIFSNEELVKMVTTHPAKILKWTDHLGSLEKGKKADFFVLKNSSKDSDDVYEKLIYAPESKITFVVIDGIPRMGYKSYMKRFEVTTEKIKFKGYTRYINLKNEMADNPVPIDISFKNAKTKLAKGLKDLPKIAKDLENTADATTTGAVGIANGNGSTRSLTNKTNRWFLEDCFHESSHFTEDGEHFHDDEDIFSPSFAMGAVPLSELLEPLSLDEPVVNKNRAYFQRIAHQINLPDYIKQKLPDFYGLKFNFEINNSQKKSIKPAAQKSFKTIQPLAGALENSGFLNLKDRLSIVREAIKLLELAYVNLPQKQRMYAANPVNQLKVLQEEMLSEDAEHLPEIEFHKRLITIFNSVRDLHTTYSLPEPFSDKVGFLPFFVEEYFEDENPRYVVSKILAQKIPSKFFKEGVEITHWNGMPINKAIQLNGEKYAGSNSTARFVRGLDSLTFRPLAMMLPPEEDWVTLTYLTAKQQKKQVTFQWLIGSLQDEVIQKFRSIDNGNLAPQFNHGYDHLTHLVHNVKKVFLAPKVSQKETSGGGQMISSRSLSDSMETSLPWIFKLKTYDSKKGKIGYLRIFSFDTRSPEPFAREFKRLVTALKTDKIIIDVRNNGGGNIQAAEYLLQALTKKKITPQPSVFLVNELTEQLCKLHAPSKTMKGLDLEKWRDSISEIKRTGARFTNGYPITSPSKMRQFVRKNKKPLKLVLITNALCYSATDLFAAGFQDHQLGTIIGTHNNTGAGGANVWKHSLLFQLTKDAQGHSAFFESLPYQADFHIAIRRTERVKKNIGIPVEDLGIEPDFIHQMTKNDLLKGNQDLINFSIEKLLEEK